MAADAIFQEQAFSGEAIPVEIERKFLVLSDNGI